MSIPHADRATPSHDVVRGGAERPSRTVATRITMVSASTIPRLMVAAATSPVVTPRVAMPTPAIVPSTIIVPISPLASPTCRAGTRSGTYPWNGPCAKFELSWSRK